MNTDSILVDSDALIALTIEKDSNHRQAEAISKILQDQKKIILSLNLVHQEVVTVLSHKTSQEMATHYYRKLLHDKPKVIPFDQVLEDEAYEIFCQQTKKGTSFIDCANMAVMKKFDISTIFSFDDIYKRNGFVRAGID